ncbi:hypothetical protein RND81_11G023000 [Saponaria officinalis]|uniref:S-protein homolog n=1 Tax=Saponaria officinalis TaxID=3572 RepID=A0AAW1HIQ9_SAPOF
MGCHQLPSFNYIFITTLIITVISTIDHMTRPVYGKQHFYLKNEIWRNPPVKYRCQSGRDDTGLHELKSGQLLDYKFTDLFFTRLYFCHFYFGRKDKVFDVYTFKMENQCRALGGMSRYYEHCYNSHIEWVIREDGFHGRCVYYKLAGCGSPPPGVEAPTTQSLVFYSW